MPDDVTPTPSGSIWTRPIVLSPRLARLAHILGIGLKALGAIVVVLFVVSLMFEAYHAWTFRPGARLMLSEHAYLRVPAGFSGFEYGRQDEPEVSKTYVLSPASNTYTGRHISVEALSPDRPLGFRDPALMAEYARKSDREVKGPVHFSYSGLEVTATVEPNLGKGRHEGAHSLQMLVDMHGQLVCIQSDSVTLGVADDVEPWAMATAAIDLLRLTTD